MKTDDNDYYLVIEAEVAYKITYNFLKYTDTDDSEDPTYLSEEDALLGKKIGDYVLDENGNVVVNANGMPQYVQKLDENGEPVPDNLGNNIESFINLSSKAGFWQKLISFFKNLFRVNRIIY